jgi:hypothetical protein
MSKFADVIARLEKAEGPDRGIDGAIAMALGLMPSGDRYTASIDAAIALVERMLPGWRWSIGTELAEDFKTTEYGGNIYPFEQPFPAELDTYGYSQANAPIAILLALFRALDAQETSK